MKANLKALNSKINEGKRLEESDIKNIIVSASKNKEFNFSFSDYCQNMLSYACLCCRGALCRKSNKENHKRKLIKKTNIDIFNDGKDRVIGYFDIIPQVRQFRELKIFM